MSKDELSRREFIRMAAALAAFGVLAWKSDELEVEAANDDLIIGVDLAEPGGGVTEEECLFFPYYMEPSSSVFVSWDDMGDGDTWGVPDDHDG